MRSRCILGVVVTLARVVPSISSAQVPSGEPYDFLRTEIGYTENELRAIADRKAVTKVVETPEPREVAIAGVVHLRASTSFFLRMFRDAGPFMDLNFGLIDIDWESRPQPSITFRVVDVMNGKAAFQHRVSLKSLQPK